MRYLRHHGVCTRPTVKACIKHASFLCRQLVRNCATFDISLQELRKGSARQTTSGARKTARDIITHAAVSPCYVKLSVLPLLCSYLCMKSAKCCALECHVWHYFDMQLQAWCQQSLMSVAGLMCSVWCHRPSCCAYHVFSVQHRLVLQRRGRCHDFIAKTMDQRIVTIRRTRNVENVNSLQQASATRTPMFGSGQDC